MAKIINGDITRITDNGILVQQVNCKGAMGAGVALAILKRWPIVRTQYLAYCKSHTPSYLFGKIQYVSVTPKLSVANSFSQLSYGTYKKQTDETCLVNNIKRIVKDNPTKDIYVPYKIGCGLAGGNWENVYHQIADIERLRILQF